MERLIITNGKLILPTGIKMGQTLICENGKIEQIIPNGSYQPLVGDKVIDAATGCGLMLPSSLYNDPRGFDAIKVCKSESALF